MSLGQILSYLLYSEKFKDLEGIFDRRDRRSNPPSSAAQIAQVAPPAIQAASSTNTAPAPSLALTHQVIPAITLPVGPIEPPIIAQVTPPPATPLPNGPIAGFGNEPLNEIEALVKLGNNNDPEACYMLFEHYSSVSHRETNDRIALDWLDRAASLNYPQALTKKGQLLQTGLKYKFDAARGALYLKKAAAAKAKLQP